MKNSDVVALQTDRQGTWIFDISSEADTVSEGLDESLSIYNTLTETFVDFVVPTEVTVTLKSFSGGMSMDSVIEASMAGDEVENSKIDFLEPDDVSTSDIRSEIPESTELSHFIPKITIDNAKVHCRLAGEDVYADKETHSARYHGDDLLENKPSSRGPLHFLVLYVKPPDRGDILVNLYISTRSDIWFEDTEIGRVNRDRLRGLLRRIDESLPVARIHRESTRWESEMKGIY
jgi:hypothetical protein